MLCQIYPTELLCFPVLCFILLCLCARLFICALWSPAGKGPTFWLSFVVCLTTDSLRRFLSFIIRMVFHKHINTIGKGWSNLCLKGSKIEISELLSISVFEDGFCLSKIKILPTSVYSLFAKIPVYQYPECKGLTECRQHNFDRTKFRPHRILGD